MELFVWRSNPAGGYCTLGMLQNVPDEYELKRGVSRLAGFPAKARFDMDAAHPKEIKLPDSIHNLDGMVVVSQPLKEFVESQSPPDTEYLPVSIYNHKKRLASDSYFIINPLSVPDCIDTKKSKIVWNKIKKDLISDCSRLVLQPTSIDPGLLLFRPKYLAKIVLVARALADAIEKQGFKGVKLIPLDEWSS
jgi:hypothetical protein